LLRQLLSLLHLGHDTPQVVRNPPAPLRPKLCLVVEGRHDIEFLKRIGAVLHDDDPSLPDLAGLERAGDVLFLPSGGGDFRPWSSRLAPLGLAEFHLYDRKSLPKPSVAARGRRS